MGKYVTASFLRRNDADEWALATERNIDRGVMPNSPDPKSVRTLGLPNHPEQLHE
jgi:hypothetical protein